MHPRPEDPQSSTLGEMSDAWLLGRARELIAAVQRSDPSEQFRMIETFDRMLEEAQHRGDPILVAQLLRAGAIARLTTHSLEHEAAPLLDEMLAHTKRHGLVLLRADAHALRGRLLVSNKQEDAAITEIARSLALLDGKPDGDDALGVRSWNRLLSSALNDSWIVLNQLGVYEAAEEVIGRAHQAIRDSAGPHEITLLLMNRIKMLLGWGLRLERVGRHDEARKKLRTAASMSVAAETPFAESLFPRRSGVPAVEQVGLLAASLALAAPNPSHIERLRRLHGEQTYPHEIIMVSIALARCLHADHRSEEALTVLFGARHTQSGDHSQPSMRLNLLRELAKFHEQELRPETPAPPTPDTGPAFTGSLDPPGNLLSNYALALEEELWSMRESHIATLHTRREHERLSAEHGAMTQQALQDPLTGLPNRRALDEQLRSLAVSSTAQPLSVALVDLDGFKGVNDEYSHAEGDDVLRVVASTLRDALRSDDIVARYGGDEFIVLLPGAPLSAAAQALGRAIHSVASLPHHLSQGVTLSVGLVGLRSQERTEDILSRADSAMYQAKRHGGNQIGTADPIDIRRTSGSPTGADPTFDTRKST